MALPRTAFVRLCRARDRLRAVDDRALTIDAIAREAAISRSHFIRQFQSGFGVTPHQYRTAAKLERARDLLARRRHYTVTDVCVELGIGDDRDLRGHLRQPDSNLRDSVGRWR